MDRIDERKGRFRVMRLWDRFCPSIGPFKLEDTFSDHYPLMERTSFFISQVRKL
jgi:hypothetical protein